MKFTLLIAGASAITLRENKPLIHPQTGLAITTTGQHWYGQPPLAMAEETPKAKEAPVVAPKAKDVGVTHYDPWVRRTVFENVNPVPLGGRATSPDGKFLNPNSVEAGGYASEWKPALAQADPVKNTCTNPNKATGVDEDCSTAGNSAWNTFSSSRTAQPKDAMAAPYPGHTLH